MDNGTESVSATQTATQLHKEYYRVNRNMFAGDTAGVGEGGNMYVMWLGNSYSLNPMREIFKYLTQHGNLLEEGNLFLQAH